MASRCVTASTGTPAATGTHIPRCWAVAVASHRVYGSYVGHVSVNHFSEISIVESTISTGITC